MSNARGKVGDGLQALYNFYYCRLYSATLIRLSGYKPFIISTIVDSRLGAQPVCSGYKPFIISTIVDSMDGSEPAAGYKPFIISTIVDVRSIILTYVWLQALYNFYYCRCVEDLTPDERLQALYNFYYCRCKLCNTPRLCGYKPFIISTIVDIDTPFIKAFRLQALYNFYYCRLSCY